MSDLDPSALAIIMLVMVAIFLIGNLLTDEPTAPDPAVTIAGSDLKVLFVPEGTQIIVLDKSITLIDTVTDAVTGRRIVAVVRGEK